MKHECVSLPLSDDLPDSGNPPVVGSAFSKHPRWRRVGNSTFKHTIIWKDIPGFPDYEVSEFGDVRQGTKYLKPEITHGTGYKRFGLNRDGRIFRYKASQLVAWAFIGPKPFDGAEVCHNDSFKHNNHYSNLRWDTHLGNMGDKFKFRAQLQDQSIFPSLRARSDTLHAEANAFLAARPRGRKKRSRLV